MTVSANRILTALVAGTAVSFSAQAQLNLPLPETRPDTTVQSDAKTPSGRFLSLPANPAREREKAAEESLGTGQRRVAQPGEDDETRDHGSRVPAFSYEFIATVDAFAKTAGGVADASATTAYPGLLEAVAQVDTGSADLWRNGLFFLHLFYSFGSSPSDFAGDVQAVSNIDDGGLHALNVWEAWYEQLFPYGHTALQIGILDYNADFYVADYAGLFINSGFGIGSELSLGGGASIYPLTSLGARLRVNPTPGSYFMAGVFDGTPGPTALDYSLNRDEGSFWAAEVGLSPREDSGYYKLGLGGWYLARDITHWIGDTVPNGSAGAFADQPFRGTGGMYLIAETAIGSRLGVFFKGGLASRDNNRYSTSYSGGFNYAGLIPGRAEDVFGVGFSRVEQSSAFLSAEGTSQNAYIDAHGYGYFKAETAYELTYSIRVADWLMIQPDVQYVLQPGMDPSIGNAVLVGARVQAVY